MFLFLLVNEKWYVWKVVSKETRFKKSVNFLQLLVLFERLMCEVEFWEVFTKKYEGFVVVPYDPLAGCRIGNLGNETPLQGFSSALLE